MKKSSKKNKSNLLLKLVILVVSLAAIGIGAYSVNYYLSSEQEEEGFFVCDNENKVCELSQHIHADIKMNICGEEVIFPKEKGDLNKTHTHKEANTIHWHDRLRVDPITREPLDPTPLKISSFLAQMEYLLPENCRENASPTLSVMVNGVETNEKLDYVWKDGDVIVVVYE